MADTQIEIQYKLLQGKEGNGVVWYSDKAFKKDKTDIQVMGDLVKITPDHKELLKHPVYGAAKE